MFLYERFRLLHAALWDADNDPSRASLRERLIYDRTFTREGLLELARDEKISNLQLVLDDADTEDVLDDANGQDLPADSGTVDPQRIVAIPLPATFTVLDLRPLNLRSTPFDHNQDIILVREEYKYMRHTMATWDGSILVTGQPGTGKTYFLFYILVDRLLMGLTTVLQPYNGTVLYLHAGGVTALTQDNIPPTLIFNDPDVWAIVDGDSHDAQPDIILTFLRLRIVTASSPQEYRLRKWMVRANCHSLAMMPWTWQELFVAGHFLDRRVMDAERLSRTFYYFGRSSRRCFHAGASEAAFHETWDMIRAAIRDIKGISRAVESSQHTSDVSHAVFELFPDPGRLLANVDIRPTSVPIVREIIRVHSEVRGEKIADLFRMTSHVAWHASAFAGRIWESAVHQYFIGKNLTFCPKPLHGGRIQFSISAISRAKNGGVFSNVRELKKLIQEQLDSSSSCYLTPASASFPGIDAIALQSSGELVFIKASASGTQDISVLGLQAVQRCLSKDHAKSSAARPSAQKPWHIVFVVPHDRPGSFNSEQRLMGSGGVSAWSAKTEQYVLLIDTSRIFMGCA